MGLKEQITEDMKAAMRAKEANKLGTIRLLTAAIKQKEVDERVVLDDIAMVGVAKGVDRDAGKEEFHRFGKPVMALRHNDPVLFFVQRLRDEVHRFAIGAHRAKRAKAVGMTPLDDIPGVGATRKRALLAHFGSAKAVARAALPDLMAVNGISEAMATVVYDFFHERG